MSSNPSHITISTGRIILAEGKDDVTFIKSVLGDKAAYVDLVDMGGKGKSKECIDKIERSLKITNFPQLYIALIRDNDWDTCDINNFNTAYNKLKNACEGMKTKLLDDPAIFIIPDDKKGSLDTLLLSYYETAEPKQYNCMKNWFDCIGGKTYKNEKSQCLVLLAGQKDCDVRGAGQFLANIIADEEKGLPHLFKHVTYIKNLIDFLEKFSKAE